MPVVETCFITPTEARSIEPTSITLEKGRKPRRHSFSSTAFSKQMLSIKGSPTIPPSATSVSDQVPLPTVDTERHLQQLSSVTHLSTIPGSPVLMISEPADTNAASAGSTTAAISSPDDKSNGQASSFFCSLEKSTSSSIPDAGVEPSVADGSNEANASANGGSQNLSSGAIAIGAGQQLKRWTISFFQTIGRRRNSLDGATPRPDIKSLELTATSTSGKEGSDGSIKDLQDSKAKDIYSSQPNKNHGTNGITIIKFASLNAAEIDADVKFKSAPSIDTTTITTTITTTTTVNAAAGNRQPTSAQPLRDRTVSLPSNIHSNPTNDQSMVDAAAAAAAAAIKDRHARMKRGSLSSGSPMKNRSTASNATPEDSKTQLPTPITAQAACAADDGDRKMSDRDAASNVIDSTAAPSSPKKDATRRSFSAGQSNFRSSLQTIILAMAKQQQQQQQQPESGVLNRVRSVQPVDLSAMQQLQEQNDARWSSPTVLSPMDGEDLSVTGRRSAFSPFAAAIVDASIAPTQMSSSSSPSSSSPSPSSSSSPVVSSAGNADVEEDAANSRVDANATKPVQPIFFHPSSKLQERLAILAQLSGAMADLSSADEEDEVEKKKFAVDDVEQDEELSADEDEMMIKPNMLDLMRQNYRQAPSRSTATTTPATSMTKETQVARDISTMVPSSTATAVPCRAEAPAAAVSLSSSSSCSSSLSSLSAPTMPTTADGASSSSSSFNMRSSFASSAISKLARSSSSPPDVPQMDSTRRDPGRPPIPPSKDMAATASPSTNIVLSPAPSRPPRRVIAGSYAVGASSVDAQMQADNLTSRRPPAVMPPPASSRIQPQQRHVLCAVYRADAVPTASALKKPTGRKRAQSLPKLRFNEEVLVGETHSVVDYLRQGEMTLRLTADMALNIKRELNEFKRCMDVHEASRHHTHFFKL